MSYPKNANKLSDKSQLNTQIYPKNEEGEVLSCCSTESRTYAITVSKKASSSEDEAAPCSGQKSFISIHSTDQLCQLATSHTSNIEECNLEVLSLNEVFPSTSEESVSNDEDSPKKNKHKKMPIQKSQSDKIKPAYAPTNSKSSTISGVKEPMDGQAPVHSDFDIPKSTMYVIGSNPGEPKMSYADPPKKISKTMKKFLRNVDKHKHDQNSKHQEQTKLAMRSILKDCRCDPECTGDSTLQAEDIQLPFPMDFGPHTKYGKHQNPDKNVTFNTQVVIIHFKGDNCVGQSVEELSKEKDQQARNSELRKTFLSKYNELWPTQK